jgi:hypothetical protein
MTEETIYGNMFVSNDFFLGMKTKVDFDLMMFLCNYFAEGEKHPKSLQFKEFPDVYESDIPFSTSLEEDENDYIGGRIEIIFDKRIVTPYGIYLVGFVEKLKAIVYCKIITREENASI